MAAFSEENLRSNLSALAVRAPSLVARLCEPVESDHVEMIAAASGSPTAALRHPGRVFLHSASDPVEEARSASRSFNGGCRRGILCLGLGLGYYLDAILKESDPCRPVLAYERDPWLLRLAFRCFDFSRDILAGRVRFLLGTDLVRLSQEDLRDCFVWSHPVLGAVYEEERHFVEAGASGRGQRALIGAGGLFVSDLADALRREGYSVLTWDPRRVSENESRHQMKTLDPHLVVTVNLCRGLPEICESLGIPLVVWEVDPSIERPLPGNRELGRSFIYTYKKSNVSLYRAAGFRHVEYLPLAANPRRRYPMELDEQETGRYGAEVSFVGSSMVSQAEALTHLYRKLTEQSSRDEGAGAASPLDYGQIFSMALERQAGECDRYVIEEMFAGRDAEGVPRSCVPDSQGRLVDLACCIGEVAASRRRMQVLSRLDGFQVDLWGDEGWKGHLPENISYRGPAGHFRELTLIYNASRVNLDINRIYQKDIATMRVFDVIACRGFVLADYSDALPDLFDVGTEVVAYRTLDELPRLVEYFLLHPSERESVAAAGYRRLLKEHTIRKRLQHMLNHLP
ncbi:MAG: glycosyltransferase [Syntrophobacteraceae bacterium]|nr:glycosyltransferase [Syntrophobacteraceae bacterium]